MNGSFICFEVKNRKNKYRRSMPSVLPIISLKVNDRKQTPKSVGFLFFCFECSREKKVFDNINGEEILSINIKSWLKREDGWYIIK